MEDNLIFKKLSNQDYDLLKTFCEHCEKLGYENNKSFKEMKIELMNWPYGQYFFAAHNNTIFSVAGVHILPEVNSNAYRCLFRGAGLPGFHTGRSGLRSSYQFIYLLNMQIDFVQSTNPNAEFYLTTNLDGDKGKSKKMNDIFCPKLAKYGIVELVDDNFYLNYTTQSLWKINVSKYKEFRVL